MSIGRLARRLPLLLPALGLAGCGVLPYYTQANEGPTAEWTPTRATMTVADEDLAANRNVFVGVAMSGGGSRAANFSAAVLFELGALDLLPAVSAISSVSGSSLTAAYYGLHGRDPGRWNADDVRARLRTNFESRWVARWFLPQNFLRGWLTDFDRTDIMAGVLDGVLFEGRRFRDLGRGRPNILINATRLSEGDNFAFTDETFANWRSRLDTYPLAHAVMASGAFPGAFHNVTLQDYGRRYVFPGTPARYEHLYDGGPADNLGVTRLLGMIRTLYSRYLEVPRVPERLPRGCFLFVVDAHTVSRGKGTEERDRRRAVDLVVDTNVLDASDVLLSLRRQDILDTVGFRGKAVGEEPFQVFPIFGDDPEAQRWCPDCTCAVWHLSFQRLLSPQREEAADPRGTYPLLVGRVVNRVPTRYLLTLSGPGRCAGQPVQDDLFEAARLLVREDKPPLRQACEWFARLGFDAARCREAAERSPDAAAGRLPACGSEAATAP